VTDHDQPGARGAATDVSDPPPPPGARRAKPQKAPRSTGRRITFWFGMTMIAAGLALLGYIAWELWGTNIISDRHQREITAQLRAEWADGTGCKVHCPEGAATALIRIPRFGKDYVVPVLEGAKDGSISEEILAEGYGHFQTGKPGGGVAEPGDVGNYAIAAHRITHGEPLRQMPELRPGDKVIVETRTNTYVYELDTNPNDLIVPFTGIWVLDALPHNPDGGVPDQVHFADQRLITLTTCSELFHTDNRMIAFGHLVRSIKKTAGQAALPGQGPGSN
jgi:sortase A